MLKVFVYLSRGIVARGGARLGQPETLRPALLARSMHPSLRVDATKYDS